MDGATPEPKLFLLYQMGSSEDYTWYSVIAVFFSQDALEDYSRRKGIEDDLQRAQPDKDGNVVLTRPSEFVVVECREGEVPDVELAESGAE